MKLPVEQFYTMLMKSLNICALINRLYAYKQTVANKFAELVYSGEWFTPLREALSAFVDSTQKTVTGKVKLKLYKGNIIPAGVTSTYSLYNENLRVLQQVNYTIIRMQKALLTFRLAFKSSCC